MNTLIRSIFWTLLALAVGGLALPDIAAAQATRDAKPVRKALASTAPDGRLSPELQRALETRPETAAALLLPAVQKVRAQSAAPSAGNLKVAPPGGGLGYICNGGNCACAGADDCVKMISADGMCTDGTVGCNAHGCTCQEK